MRTIERDGQTYREYRDQETATLTMSPKLWRRLVDEYLTDDWCGVLSVLDGPAGTSWVFEIRADLKIHSITAITGYDPSPGFVIKPRPGVRIVD